MEYLEYVIEAFKSQRQDPGSLHGIRRAVVLACLQQVANNGGEIAQVATEQCLWAALALWLPR